jgi:hypothetical protein
VLVEKYPYPHHAVKAGSLAATPAKGDGRREESRMTPPTLGLKFVDALMLAVRVHDGELRKGSEIPYVSHLLSVCALVLW